jgi:hypothetical protein
VVLILYGCGSAFLLARWLLGHFALWRLLRRAGPAPGPVAQLFEEMAARLPWARLLVSGQVRAPFSCGLLRPTVVLPAALTERMPAGELRWVFAHELTHLERRDAWASLLFGLGQAVYFFLPWFWWLRRQVRLCQEYLADAAAARTGRPVDYAEFLVGWTTAPAAPTGAAGVSGPGSDLFRRIAMLLYNPTPLERRCPRRWSALAGGGLLTLAVLGAGLGLGVHASPGATERESPKKEEPKKAPAKKEEPKKADADPDAPDVSDIEQLHGNLQKLQQEQWEATRKILEQHRAQFQQTVEALRKQRTGPQGRFPQGRGGIPLMPNFPGLAGPAPAGPGAEPRLGARVAVPSETLVEQLDLPRDQGVVVEDVMANSPAEKAGLKPHDVLLELAGKPVPSKVEDLVKMIGEIKAKTPVDVVVLRKGKRETLKGLSLPEARAAAPAPEQPDLGNLFAPGFALPRGGNVGPLVVPPLQLPNVDVLGNLAQGLGGGGVMTTTFRTGDRFTTRHQEGSLVITVTGKVADGKSTVGEIRVQDGVESHTYASPDRVPEQYRDKVKNLIEMTEKGNARIQIKTP